MGTTAWHRLQRRDRGPPRVEETWSPADDDIDQIEPMVGPERRARE